MGTTASPSTSSASPDGIGSSLRIITVPTTTGDVLSSVKIFDVTFTGGGNGWALATADCLKGAGTCSALLHTSDDGRQWQSRPGTPFAVGSSCTKNDCVSHIRFATDKIGYAFGRSALYMTTNGAKSWTHLGGGADALETLDGNVIRVSSDASSCPPGCDFTVATADVGSPDFQTASLPGTSAGDGVTLSRIGSHAYLLANGNPAGGANDATSVLWSSSDDGQSWRNRGEPCSQRAGESDSTDLTTAADGSVLVLCRARAGGHGQAVATSTDGGASFSTGPSSLGAAPAGAIGAASAKTLLVSLDETFRSTDGGRSFSRPSGGVEVGPASYIGFASDTVAHAISSDGKIIFTTNNAGRTWQAARFR